MSVPAGWVCSSQYDFSAASKFSTVQSDNARNRVSGFDRRGFGLFRTVPTTTHDDQERSHRDHLPETGSHEMHPNRMKSGSGKLVVYGTQQQTQGQAVRLRSGQ